MLTTLFKIYAYGWKSLIQRPVLFDDPGLTGLKHSKIGTALLEQALGNGIPIKRAELKRASGYYDSKAKTIVLGDPAGFCTVAHETAHHNHNDSLENSDNYNETDTDMLLEILTHAKRSYKDNLLRRLIHEAEAYAVQALVVLEVHENPNKDFTLTNRTERSKKRIKDIYPGFDKYLYGRQTEESKRELAANVFQSYLTQDNSAFNYHLDSYFKFPSRFPRSLSVVANTLLVAGGVATINLGLSNWPDLLDFGIKGNSMIALFYTIMEANRSDEYKQQSSFSEVFETTDLGHVPKLEGNYLDAICDTDMSQFDGTLQRISDHVDNEINAFERCILEMENPHIQSATMRWGHFMNLMPRI